MKNLLFLAVLTCTSFAWSQSDKVAQAGLGENASPEYKNCLKEDKCPSQQCPNSCAMMNAAQNREDASAQAAAIKAKANKAGTR